MARWPWSRSERFNTWSAAEAAFAAWLRGDEDENGEVVSAYTVMGLSAVLRAVLLISGTIAGLPLKTYERVGENDRTRVPNSVFDDPYPGIDNLTPFAWVETVLIHLLLWRRAFLWHEARDARTGEITSYRPIVPDLISKVELVNGRKRFTYRDEAGQEQTVGSEMITHIPGPSMDGVDGHPMLRYAQAIFSGAISGDKAAALTLRRGIRLAGLVTPEEDEEFNDTEGEAILKQLQDRVVGREHSGDIALINKRLKLQPWIPTNIDLQWAETRQAVLGEVGRLFGIPPHLLNDIEKQTSWGTGVSEQNAGLARFTLMGWSSRIEQVLSQRLPRDQFVEFDYRGLLQGTPKEAFDLVNAELEAGMIDLPYACRLLNLPAPSPEQIAQHNARMASGGAPTLLPRIAAKESAV